MGKRNNKYKRKLRKTPVVVHVDSSGEHRMYDDPDGGEQRAYVALQDLAEQITGRRPGLLDSLDPDTTAFEDLFGYTPGDQ